MKRYYSAFVGAPSPHWASWNTCSGITHLSVDYTLSHTSTRATGKLGARVPQYRIKDVDSLLVCIESTQYFKSYHPRADLHGCSCSYAYARARWTSRIRKQKRRKKRTCLTSTNG